MDHSGGKTMSKDKFKFNVMMFGGKRTGKTSVLAALQECFDKKFSNVGLTISPDDKATTTKLEAKRQEMDDYFTKTAELFECKDSPTKDKATYSFKIQIQGGTIQSLKTSCPRNKDKRASKAEIPAFARVDVRDFIVRKSLAPCSERNVPMTLLFILTIRRSRSA